MMAANSPENELPDAQITAWAQSPEPSSTAPSPEASQTPATTPTPPPTPEPEPEPEPITPRIYDIPLDAELQEFTFWRCEELGLDYEMVLALIEQESSYRVKVVSATEDYGLMQINSINHERLQQSLGITNFLDAKQNIIAGTEILAELAAKYEDLHQILMAYNMGERGAKKHWEEGTTTSRHSRAVMEIRARLIEEGEYAD